jgi:hypothetical protein
MRAWRDSNPQPSDPTSDEASKARVLCLVQSRTKARLSLRRVRLSGKSYLLGRCLPVNSHRAGGGRNRPHPVTRHRNTGCCSEFVAHFLCGLHEPLWLCRAHYVLARISSKCRCAESEREHDTCASNRRTAQATNPVSYSHAVNVIPFRILRKLI